MFRQKAGIGNHLRELEPRLDLRFRGRIWQIDHRGLLNPIAPPRFPSASEPIVDLLGQKLFAVQTLEPGEHMEAGETVRGRVRSTKEHPEHRAPSCQCARLEIQRAQVQLGHLSHTHRTVQEPSDGLEIEVQRA